VLKISYIVRYLVRQPIEINFNNITAIIEMNINKLATNGNKYYGAVLF